MNKILGILIILVLFTSCYDVSNYPPEPEIKYKSFKLRDTIDALDNPVLAGTLRFEFTDGDGDVGSYESNDTSETEDNKNLFIELLIKNNSVFEPVDLPIPYEYRIPYFETSANNPLLKGEIHVSEINFSPPYEGDTIKLRFKIFDRAGNVSNVEETPAVVLLDSLN